MRDTFRPGPILTFLLGVQFAVGCFCAPAHAGSMEVTIDGSRTPLYVDERGGIFISESCRKDTGKLDCEAFRALSKASLKRLRSQLQGGANPGAVVCGTVGGRTLLAVDAARNSTSYCRFGDGSIVASGTLGHFARKNDDRDANR